VEPLREEVSHFLDCIKTRSTPLTDGENGVRVLRVLDACQRSIDAGGAVVSLGESGA
jgi:UDP-2-acetamido-3-amino-2,3-dideoxy-glucuronate N-acetyltransferase